MTKIDNNGRQKMEIMVDDEEVFSMVTIFETERGVEVRAESVEVLSPDKNIVQELRQLETYSFYSLPTDLMKTNFRSFIINKPDKFAVGSKRWLDAKAVFTAQEFIELEKLTNTSVTPID